MLEGQCCWSGLNSLACDEGSVPAPRLSLVGSVRSFLHSGAPATQAAPPRLQSCWKSPGCLSQIGIRGREPQAGTGKRAQVVFLHSENSALLVQTPAGPWELPAGVNVSLGGLTGTYSRGPELSLLSEVGLCGLCLLVLLGILL